MPYVMIKMPFNLSHDREEEKIYIQEFQVLVI